VEGVVFPRFPSKSQKEKQKMLKTLINFKQGLSEKQIEYLRQRQFVVVDTAKIKEEQQKKRAALNAIRERHTATVQGTSVGKIDPPSLVSSRTPDPTTTRTGAAQSIS